jgi:hypothetical protein
LILHDAGDEVKDVAVVVGAGIDDVDDVEPADGFLGGDLRRVDGDWRFVDVDNLAHFPLMRQDNFEDRTGRDLDDGFDDFIEAFFFDSKLIGSGRQRRKRAAAGEVGEAAKRGQRRGLDKHASGRDGDSILIGDGNGGSRNRLGRGSAS